MKAKVKVRTTDQIPPVQNKRRQSIGEHPTSASARNVMASRRAAEDAHGRSRRRRVDSAEIVERLPQLLGLEKKSRAGTSVIPREKLRGYSLTKTMRAEATAAMKKMAQRLLRHYGAKFQRRIMSAGKPPDVDAGGRRERMPGCSFTA